MSSAILWIRSLLFSVFFFLWTIVPPFLLFWIVVLRREYVVKAIYGWQYVATLSAKIIAGIDYQVIGRENIPDGPCIIAAKHQSAWETCLLHLLFDAPAIVLKKELTYIPVWGWFAAASGLIPVDRKGGAKALIEMKKAADEAIAMGRKIVIFPQGTRVRPGVHVPYKVGVAAMYQDLKLPIVPMALNSGLFWPKRSFLKKPGTITIEFLPPIPAGLSRSKVMRALEEALEAASNRLAGIEPPVLEEKLTKNAGFSATNALSSSKKV